MARFAETVDFSYAAFSGGDEDQIAHGQVCPRCGHCPRCELHFHLPPRPKTFPHRLSNRLLKIPLERTGRRRQLQRERKPLIFLVPGIAFDHPAIYDVNSQVGVYHRP
jgi:hypothetical protein